MKKTPLFRIALDINIEGIHEIAGLLRELLAKRHKHPHLTGGKFVITIKDNTPDGTYDISGVSVTDAEGSPVPDAALTYEVASTDDSVFSVTPDVDPKTGSYHVGAPGVASVNVQIKTADGTVLGSFGEQFTVTAGDPAAIAGGTISFSGLTEDAPPPGP